MSPHLQVVLLCSLLILCPVLAWLRGVFNPYGYGAVRPWHVPPCTCRGSGCRREATCERVTGGAR